MAGLKLKRPATEECQVRPILKGDEMEIFRINIKPQADIERHEAFKKSQHNCPMCDAKLEFELAAGPTLMSLIEKARCTECDIDIRTEIHTEQ